MTVSQKVIKETAEILKAEQEFHTRQIEKFSDNQIEVNVYRSALSMTEYFARRMAYIFKNDNPKFDKNKFYKACNMEWMITSHG